MFKRIILNQPITAIPNYPRKKRKKAEQKKQNSPGLFDKIFSKIMTGTQDIIDNITEDEGEYNYDDER